MDDLWLAVDGLLAWLARVVRSNVLFGVIVVTVVGALVGAAWWALSR